MPQKPVLPVKFSSQPVVLESDPKPGLLVCPLLTPASFILYIQVAHFLSLPLDVAVIFSTPLGKALIEFLLVHNFAAATPVKNLVPRSHGAAPV